MTNQQISGFKFARYWKGYPYGDCQLLFALSSVPYARRKPNPLFVMPIAFALSSRPSGSLSHQTPPGRFCTPITDAYLLGLAIHHKGKLATLDRAIVYLAGSEFAEYVELIQ